MKYFISIIGFLLISSSAFADSPYSLLRGGWDVLYEGYESVEECTPDEEPMRMGMYLVKCDGYEYPYHYGDVILFGKSFLYEGNILNWYKLCLVEDDDYCIDVDVYEG